MSVGQGGAPAPYRIEVAASAKRSLHRLPAKVAAAIVEFITGPLAENPLRLSKPLRYELEGYRSARRGDYRVLLRVDSSARIILIVDVDHRAWVYRPR